MGINFACPACSRRFTLDDRLAGKRGKCKSCGTEIRVPSFAEDLPDPTETGAIDPYGLEDALFSTRRAHGSGEVGHEAAIAEESARSGGRQRKPSGRKGSKGDPWGVEMRRNACAALYFGFFASRFLRVLPAEFQSSPFGMLMAYGMLALMGLGVLMTFGVLVGASASLMSGNRRAFGSDTSGDRWGLISLFVFAPVFVFALGYRWTHPLARGQVRPGAIAGGGLLGGVMPVAPREPEAPWKGLSSGVRSNIHVTLSNGRFLRNTSPLGTTLPGVEISIDYQIDSGELNGIEQLVLVIRSSKGRGELDNLHKLRFQRSGTIHASSFIATPQDGPYEAWVEVASLPGGAGDRKQVSSPLTLQFADVPAFDPGAESRAAAEAQLPEMMKMHQGPAPGVRPGFPRAGQQGPMVPSGPRGGRFGVGPP